MSVVASVLPFIILLIIIVAVIVVVLRGFNRVNITRKGYWILGGYVIVLLLSVVIYYFIPGPKEESQQAPTGRQDLSEVLYGELPVESINEYFEEEWDFSYDKDSIQIGYKGDLNNSVSIAVERTDGNSIKAAFYQTPIYASGIELTEHIKPIDMQLSEDRFLINLPETVHLDFTSFRKEFPLLQFKDSPNEDWMGDSERFHWGDQLLYLQIPREIEIKTEMDVYLEYVNK
ncbi:hypothetical protein [Oceanobacillus chungangensis]|uniref:Uncharacterized protein n=1 Tax=Oceanobacillus chungangensis TaxID=1229152 RepID=A0A3D8Q2J4_9BACI|nr:hypothetical protein [Oceanobacillus chungangensis]RDW21265.1 hypothetical protein CWR45_03210 [Oceanobacillus chungangensis]